MFLRTCEGSSFLVWARIQSLRIYCALGSLLKSHTSMNDISLLLQLQTDVVTRAIDLYQEKLCVFGHIGLPRFHQPKSFNDRIDPFLLMLCRACPKLHTLVSNLIKLSSFKGPIASKGFKRLKVGLVGYLSSNGQLKLCIHCLQPNKYKYYRPYI